MSVGIRMKSKGVNQSNNDVGGDIVGRDKITIVEIKKEISKPTSPLRSELNFEINGDENNSTLLRKLKDGEVNPFLRRKASQRKLETLKILLDMCKTDSGRKIVADIYENLTAMIENKYLMHMDEGELLKTNMDQIHEDFSEVISKYEHLVVIDESFLTGLLYIATSNCAIMWKLEEDVS
ncbi:hypothetical protein DFO73_103453 [Cytobacillus oceanisediminis]|uniref:Uncharacterized protein n=2 Tax=Cytobacillus oceanisediminis TaxID=665099 RepID=A0A2V3A492_9BACI|nr:hypothetical protein DFO73_103453 [Cytobacillus oceanisediminis]